jgi:hypothetical protein
VPITIKVNGTVNSLVHKMSNGISTATIPDVCKTPSPAGPVPIPYPNIAQSITLSGGTTTVKGDKMMAANKGSKFALSNGDNAGVAGGVKSSTFMKEATWILYSFDVKLQKKNASRLSDKMFHNSENAANLTGEIQLIQYVEDDEILNALCNIFCSVREKGHKSKKNPYPYSREAQKLAGKEPFKSLFTKHNLVPERSVLVSVASALVGKRSVYAAATVLGRIARKVAAGAAGYSGVFRPIVNVASLLFDVAAGPIASPANAAALGGATGVGMSIIRIKPDVAALGPQGQLTKAYDYKFDYKSGQTDSFQNSQDKIYKKATGKEPQSVDLKSCNGCVAAT